MLDVDLGCDVSSRFCVAGHEIGVRHDFVGVEGLVHHLRAVLIVEARYALRACGALNPTILPNRHTIDMECLSGSLAVSSGYSTLR